MNFTSSLNYVETLKQDASGSLNLYGSGSLGRTEIFSIDGNNGRLFTVSDDLSNSLFSVNTIAGLPVIEAFANNTVVMGQYGTNALVVSGSNVGIGTASPSSSYKLDVNGGVRISQSISGGGYASPGTSFTYYSIDGAIGGYGGFSFASKSDIDLDGYGTVGISLNPDGGINLYNNSLDNGSQSSIYFNIYEFTVQSGGDISFRTKPSTTYQTSVFIKKTGEVGIGTTSPSEKLEVNGKVKATGFKKDGGTETQFLMADGSTNSNTYAKTDGTNASGNWSNTSSGLSLNPSVAGKTLNASGQDVYLRDATYGQISGIVQDATDSPLASQWSNRLKTLHNNSQGYFTELAQSFTGTEGVWHRRNSAGTISSWKQLYDDSIWSAASLSYSGSTLTLTINGISKTTTINAGTSYTLPTASATDLGGVKIGSGITITNGVISANTFTPGTTNRLAKFSGSNLADSIIYDNGSSVGIGTTTPSSSYKLDVNGTIRATQEITALDFIGTSDFNFKENIETYNEKPLNTKYRTFNFKNDNMLRIGLIAQELEQYHPEFVRTDRSGTKSISYIDLHSAEIAYLKKYCTELENELNKIKSKI